MTDTIDLIKNVADQKPAEFAQSFQDRIRDIISGKVADRKVELAQTMFGQSSQLPDDEKSPDAGDEGDDSQVDDDESEGDDDEDDDKETNESSNKPKDKPEQLNAWGQTSKTAKDVRKQLSTNKKNERIQKLFRKRGYGLP